MITCYSLLIFLLPVRRRLPILLKLSGISVHFPQKQVSCCPLTIQSQLQSCLPAPLHHWRQNPNMYFGTGSKRLLCLLFGKGDRSIRGTGVEGKQQGPAQEGLWWLGEVGDSAKVMRSVSKGMLCEVGR